MIDYLIVGAGLFGATFAHLAKTKNKTVIIIDKRSHIAGNCYTEKKYEIDVHKYGPHIFHTNNKDIWNFVNRFSDFNSFIYRPKVSYGNRVYSFPINLMTFNQLWGITTPKEAIDKIESIRIPIRDKIENLEDWVLDKIGKELYDIFIRGYTKKQWGTDPKNLPSEIIKRIPIRFDYNDNYFNDEYQGIPKLGYTEMIKNIMGDTEVILNHDYLNNIDYWSKIAKKIVYTGSLDDLHEYVYGRLPYRSLVFKEEILDINDFQGNAAMNYTDEDIPFTRIIEHKHFTFKKDNNKTIITKEYPVDHRGSGDRFYPINNVENNKQYEKYVKLTEIKYPNLILGGRLAEYKYYDMHQVIGSAFNKFNKYEK